MIKELAIGGGSSNIEGAGAGGPIKVSIKKKGPGVSIERDV